MVGKAKDEKAILLGSFVTDLSLVAETPGMNQTLNPQ
jgi:hypothetical protein